MTLTRGEYVVVDLDANNWVSRDAWQQRNPGKVLASFGWGVCRHGYGLQAETYTSEADANAAAARMNATREEGAKPTT